MFNKKYVIPTKVGVREIGSIRTSVKNEGIWDIGIKIC